MMELHKFYDLVKDGNFNEAHKWLDDELKEANGDDARWVHHRRIGVYIADHRYQDAITHLQQHRMNCGTITSVHDTLAMLYEISGRDDLALEELETAPYVADQEADPLLIADAKFYRLYFRARRHLPVDQSELDLFPARYETYLPSSGRLRGVLIRKSDIVALSQNRQIGDV